MVLPRRHSLWRNSCLLNHYSSWTHYIHWIMHMGLHNLIITCYSSNGAIFAFAVIQGAGNLLSKFNMHMKGFCPASFFLFVLKFGVQWKQDFRWINSVILLKLGYWLLFPYKILKDTNINYFSLLLVNKFNTDQRT